MKKLLAVLILLIGITSAQAHGYYRGGGYWVAPAIVGGVIGYSLARPYYPPSVVYVQPSPTVVYTQQPYAVMPLPTGYHYQYVTDPACNCLKVALVPN